jgi:hypothetical protein
MSEVDTAAAEIAAPIVEEVDETGAEDIIENSTEPVKEPIKASNKRSLDIKVNGKSRKVDLDFDNEDEIKGYLSKAFGADEAFQKSAAERKQVEAFIKELKTNPLAILRNKELGLNLRELAEKVLLEDLEDEAKSPEQKELESLKKQLTERDTKAKELEEEKRSSELARLQEKQFTEFDNQITDALSKYSVPKTPYVVKRIADTMLEVAQLMDDKGNPMYPDATVDDIMPYVEEQIQKEISQMFEAFPTETLEKLVGKTHLNKMRNNRVAKIKQTATASQIKDTGNAAKPPETKAEKKSSFKSVFGRGF